MNNQNSLGDLATVFATFGIDPVERDLRELREIMGTSRPSDNIFYRTVLTNGTGRIRTDSKEADYAELERNIS
ncbi:hypothetical protein [Xanthomonas sp. LMG 12459]|uniref:hypothetical protein n=1 Tax=Xanthomonas sp. LMG 12459 TaxID=1591131 RepID=UPI001263C68E|nr:hypothetical protein [Xanthomonas sp. LMG 12459]